MFSGRTRELSCYFQIESVISAQSSVQIPLLKTYKKECHQLRWIICMIYAWDLRFIDITSTHLILLYRTLLRLNMASGEGQEYHALGFYPLI